MKHTKNCASWTVAFDGQNKLCDCQLIYQLPRRVNIALMFPAELAIREAMIKVEEIGCDTQLTDAVIFLSQAQNKVADYFDQKEREAQKLKIAQPIATALANAGMLAAADKTSTKLTEKAIADASQVIAKNLYDTGL
jgi:hypothetical protein